MVRAVRGALQAIAWRQGSSGVFTGDICGLYQGYRFASETPDVQQFQLPLPGGVLGIIVRQEIVTPLPDRPSVHPFAGGADPFSDKAGFLSRYLPAASTPAAASQDLAAMPSAKSGAKFHYVSVQLHADPQTSTGIYAGARGAIELDAPEYRTAGHLVIDCDGGHLQCDFSEWSIGLTLRAALTVDGDASTGVWRGASGSLTFELTMEPPLFGQGSYEGEITVQAPVGG